MGRTVNTSALVVTLLFAAKAAVLAGEADPENRDLFTSSTPPANIGPPGMSRSSAILVVLTLTHS